MPPRDWRMRIEDILDAIARIQDYTRGMTFEAFSHDRKTIDAVVRNITVIGEAAGNTPPAVAGHARLANAVRARRGGSRAVGKRRSSRVRKHPVRLIRPWYVPRRGA